MKQHFYTHIISHDDIGIQLTLLGISEKEKEQLLIIVASSIHHVVLDVVLTELPDNEKKTFLQHLDENDHEKIWDHIKKHVKDPEKKISHAAEKMKQGFIKDIKKLQSKL